MSTNDELRPFEYLPNVNVNAAITPRIEIPLTPEAKTDMIQSAKTSYGPAPIEKAIEFLMAFDRWIADHPI